MVKCLKESKNPIAGYVHLEMHNKYTRFDARTIGTTYMLSITGLLSSEET